MAKASVKRRQEPKPEAGSLAELFGGSTTVTEPEDTEVKTAAVTQEDLLARLGALETELAQSKRERDAMLSVQPVVVQDTPKAPVLNMDNMPDPQFDKDAYSQELAKRTQAYVQDTWAYNNKVTSNARTAETDRADQSKGLWADFVEKYDAYAEEEDKVKFAAERVATRLSKKRVDVEKYMFTHSDSYMQDVVAEFDKTFGKPGEVADVKLGAQDEPASRTGGLFGGSGGGERMTKTQKEEAGDMISELQDMQRKTGLF